MISGLSDDIEVPGVLSSEGIELPELSIDAQDSPDLFAERKQKAWNAAGDVARADITKYLVHYSQRTVRAGFLSHWRRSLMGPTLADLKGDDNMVQVFARNSVRMILSVVGSVMSPDSWAVVTAPRRRHKERNFAHLVAAEIARMIGLPFFADSAFAPSRHRVGTVFTPGNIPAQPNVIVYDDIVTTGSTIASMKNLLEPMGKTTLFFASIDNS